jgi:hypothetical protein
VIPFIYASDEVPEWVDSQTFNDVPGIIVEGISPPLAARNIALFRKLVGTQVIEQPLRLYDVKDCSIFKKAQVAPWPANLQVVSPDGHKWPIPAPFYDHEFGGFTQQLARDTGDHPLDPNCKILEPGTYRIKIIVEDFNDPNQASALFLEKNSIRLLTGFIPGDLTLDGKVDAADLNIVGSNWQQTGKTYCEGDANFDGIVNAADLNILGLHWLESGGSGDFKADFNRDGHVTTEDHNIWSANEGLDKCGSRYEGDATDDGKVDDSDEAIFFLQLGS